jgi:DNA-binding NarL/FixJ family response regulator
MKFLVVDDHALIRSAMRGLLLGLQADADVLEAGDGAAALGLLAAQPDIDLVLLDLHLPDADGLALLATVGERHPGVAVVMLSGDKDQATIRRALELGAQGYIPKAEPQAVLAGALSLVLAGGVYVPPAALGRAAPAPAPVVAAPSPSAPQGPTPQSLGLTDRQLEVLALLMEGKNNKLICRALDLAEPTVKNHVSAILRALGVGSRTEAVLAVARRGWTLPPVRRG